jgi:hypothetical protein
MRVLYFDMSSTKREKLSMITLNQKIPFKLFRNLVSENLRSKKQTKLNLCSEDQRNFKQNRCQDDSLLTVFGALILILMMKLMKSL